jgi:hypothetical protein
MMKSVLKIVYHGWIRLLKAFPILTPMHIFLYYCHWQAKTELHLYHSIVKDKPYKMRIPYYNQMMILLIASLTVVVGNLIADLMYAVLDPRVRL